MTSDEIIAVQTDLVTCGWRLKVDGNYGPITTEAVADFQAGYSFRYLAVDGIVGPMTLEALDDCCRNPERQPGCCGTYFHFSEFRSKGNGWIKVHAALVRRLDALREHVGPISIISGYRDSAHNKSVGGAANSQHVYGTAADIGGYDLALCTELGFSGIGISPDGSVAHVDVRAEGPNNTTGANIGSPTLWYY